MSHFEFIMIMLSIIVGLGVSVLLTNVARQIKAGTNCKPYWVQSILTLTIFIALLQQWWESWDLQTVDSWTFPIVLMMLGSPVGLFIISHLLFPERLNGADLQQHYFKSSQGAWSIAALVVIASTLFRPLAFGYTLLEWDNAAPISLLFVFGVLFFPIIRKYTRYWFRCYLLPWFRIFLFSIRLFDYWQTLALSSYRIRMNRMTI